MSYVWQIRDAYMLKIFEDNRTRLPSWCDAEAYDLPFCQILGEYRMELPQYNTLEPYAKMNENCPSLPPSYERPPSCWFLMLEMPLNLQMVMVFLGLFGSSGNILLLKKTTDIDTVIR